MRPLRSTFFCVSDRVVFVAKITNASSTVCDWLLSGFVLGGLGLGIVVSVWLGCGLSLSNMILF